MAIPCFRRLDKIIWTIMQQTKMAIPRLRADARVRDVRRSSLRRRLLNTITWQALGLGPVAYELLLPLKVLWLISISNSGSGVYIYIYIYTCIYTYIYTYIYIYIHTLQNLWWRGKPQTPGRRAVLHVEARGLPEAQRCHGGLQYGIRFL